MGLFGIHRLEVDASLSQLFRSDNAEFRQYEAVSKQFPSNAYDVSAVVTGPVGERASIEALRNLATDLQLFDGARGLVSIFSARTAPTSGRLPAPRGLVAELVGGLDDDVGRAGDQILGLQQAADGGFRDESEGRRVGLVLPVDGAR